MNGRPSIAVAVSTLGNRPDTLRRLLDSIRAQNLLPEDRIYVVVDGPRCIEEDPEQRCDAGLLMDEFRACAARGECGAAWIHLHHEDHCWGHPQRNWLLDQHAMSADLLSQNDDDDVYNPGAFEAIRRRAEANPGKVLLFRFTTAGREVLWKHNEFRESRYGGHGIVVPNVEGRIGRWGRRYAGDWEYVESTLALNGGVENAVFCEENIATARP